VKALVVAAAMLAPRLAAAGNEDSFLFGERAVLVGGAIVATTNDTAALWYNPAGLGENARDRVEISGTAFTLRSRTIPGGLALDLPSGRSEFEIASREVFAVPAALAVARHVGDRISIAAGVFVSEEDLFQFKAEHQVADNAIALDVAGALEGSLIRYHLGAGIGYRVSPRVSIGATLFGIYEDYREFRKLFATATSSGAYTSTFFQRLVDARATRYGAELLVGAQLDAGGGWRIGITARSPRLVLREDTETDNSTVLQSQGPAVTPVVFSQVDHDPIAYEGTGFTRPARFVAGVARHAGALDASVELDVRTSGVGATAQRAVWNARAGAAWSASARTTFGAGVFTDRSGAAPPAQFPDYRVDYYGLSVGWKRDNTVRLHAREPASTLVFSTTIAVRYALGLGQSTRIRFDFTQTPTDGSVGRFADERVDVTYHELAVYVASGLAF
jgi:hypothetical protein